MNVRTRFSPSPTGFLHVGGIRTALFAWLLARQSGEGRFILRLEDTDKAREVTGSDQHIFDSLKALGLIYDEGPDIGGPFAPYRQSERLDTYKKWAEKLVDQGRAYVDPYSPEEVQKFREQAQIEKKPFLYRNHRPENPPEWDGSKPLRFKSDPKAYKWHDEVMGDLSTGPEVIDDFILIKSDGFPTYNFAHIIDDLLMECTHVIRGQEFLASVPNYLNLYEALAIEKPLLATVPHILGPDGNKKLSKRDGAKDVMDYIREGYLPEALVNFIASLGWNDGSEQEVFSIQELIDKFSLRRVQKSGAKFDEKRLLWINGTHIRNLTLDDIYTRCKGFWPAEAADYDDTYRKKVLELVQERLKYFAELPELTSFFFKDLPVDMELINNDKQLKKFSHDELKELLEKTKTTLEQSDFSTADLTKKLNLLLETTGQKPRVLFSLIRIATTQAPASPGLADTLVILGKETTLKRINTTRVMLETK
ncbi:glutamate--tRNA ligase [Candidatus Saccharibacteria bacterium]|nr:glutamate--tRNA ligase [Candidatus Saccharibacteria bacterium]MBI3338317.1 glutamate--tRNA ligase [Candidatus Saccharibacteria bacterium]